MSINEHGSLCYHMDCLWLNLESRVGDHLWSPRSIGDRILLKKRVFSTDDFQCKGLGHGWFPIQRPGAWTLLMSDEMNCPDNCVLAPGQCLWLNVTKWLWLPGKRQYLHNIMPGWSISGLKGLKMGQILPAKWVSSWIYLLGELKIKYLSLPKFR